MTKYTILLFIWLPSFGQTVDLKSQADKILEKGDNFYRLIIANSKTLELTDTDDLIFSYKENEELISIVFAADKSDKVLRTIKFDWTSLNILSDNKELRTETKAEGLFKKMVLNMYASTKYFPLPKEFWAIIENQDGGFSAYLLPRQESSSELILGNDFIFKYKLTGEFKDVKYLHNNAIPILTKFQNKDELEGTLHIHANRNDDFITALDIATILSYKEKVDWTKHLVASNKYVSIFNIDKMTLEIITRREYETRTGKRLKL
ncbi:MAG: hypothetical protein HOP30_09270 [Cyclobacteriaceae bacterium]|nr:hypothetical protein [Cyclobacteriaceae bacterium]